VNSFCFGIGDGVGGGHASVASGSGDGWGEGTGYGGTWEDHYDGFGLLRGDGDGHGDAAGFCWSYGCADGQGSHAGDGFASAEEM